MSRSIRAVLQPEFEFLLRSNPADRNHTLVLSGARVLDRIRRSKSYLSAVPSRVSEPGQRSSSYFYGTGSVNNCEVLSLFREVLPATAVD